jgi:tetratricopeptide (TPR) repeat protein
MSDQFDLVVTADYLSRTAELRLLDGHGSQIAYRRTDFKDIAVSRQQGLFDLRNYLRHYVDDGNEAASVAEIGVCIAEEVLGAEIFRKLWESKAQRTLRIQLPGASEEENLLAAALARVPWEIARPAAGEPALGERHLLVRVVHDMAEPKSTPLKLGPDESLRVLLVFAEARGSRPLAARRERRELLELFEREIYPKRRVVAHVLSHGVTRERLEAQIRENGGYHVIHWSGHGHRNLLELAKPGGGSDRVSGNELLDLCGGFIPRLVFLSACHSGDILSVRSWDEFLAVAQGQSPGAKQSPPAETKDIPLDKPAGYTGTAHALLQGGVPSVVAMRYAVGDEYARELGIAFYRALLAYAQPQNAAAALTTARQSLLDQTKQAGTRYAICDHATPVFYGAEQSGLTLPKGRSPALEPRDPRLHQIVELTTAGHQHFVGRTWELAGLGAEFIGSRAGAEVKPVAVITGLGGMGKTALTAEVLALWGSRFEWVLIFQAKPNALGIDRDFLWDSHIRLTDRSDSYRERIAANSRDAVWLQADGDFAGTRRMEVMMANLVEFFRAYRILLVLDNFETNLKPQAEPSGLAGEPVWACQDPAWDRCLAVLASELAGSPSRVLITCRRPLAALAGTSCHGVLLGPLPSGEAALYLREHAGLSMMVFGGDPAERALAMRLLNASRFYPLLMDRLSRLATGGPALRAQLMQALDTLEKSKDFAQLPALFAASPGDAKELAYLNDALTTSLEQLIRDAGPDARRLLWMIALANDPVSLVLLKGAWSGESHEQQHLRQVKQMLEKLPMLPPELQAQLNAMPAEFRAKIDALPPAAPARSDPAPLLRHLVAVGLASEERTGSDDEHPDLTCHELVRERILAWMHDHPTDRADLTENAIRLAFAERLEAVFEDLQHKNMTAALAAGSRALVYCVQAGAHDRLSSFATTVVTSSSDPRLLEGLLPHLEAAAASAPDGKPRWSCLAYLADALRRSGRPDTSLPFYEQAASQARAVAEAGREDGRQAWGDLAMITANWAIAHAMTGALDASRQRQLDSAEAYKQAGGPAINIIGRELEALRIDIQRGRAAEALPQVATRLAKVEAWWQQHRSGHAVPEVPNAEFLARALISALDVARAAHCEQEDWEPALRRIDTGLAVKRALERPAEDIASTRMNRAVVLGRLGRHGEAQAELEAGLHVFQNDPAGRAKVLSSLAILFDDRDDVTQAITQERRALAIRDQLPDPGDRAISHGNLANYLEHSATPSALAEAPRHQLATLLYLLLSGLGQDLQTTLRNYANVFRRARAAGTPPVIPRLAELLADPAFRPLDDWLRQRGADVNAMQAKVDQFLELARQAALNEQ